MSTLVTRADLLADGFGPSLLKKCQADPFPGTLHRIADHSSHTLTEAQVRHLDELNRPYRPKRCQECNWPGSIGELCKICCDLVDAVARQPGLLEEHRMWRQKHILRRMGLL